MDIKSFAKNVLGRNLYPYQIEVAEAILDSVLKKKGLTFSVMFARQMGKNEISAVIEAYLLTKMGAGNIVKSAPTFKPQIVNSRLRLLTMLENPWTRKRIWRSYGYMIGVAPDPGQRSAQTGPRVMFFSADPDASIVGATASILLEVDEAQDVSADKFNRDLKPMAATSNATTILYGTAWSDESLLAQVKATNQELEQRDGIRRHFQYDWTTLAGMNPNYKQFVENEILRLGEEHITIKTQYRLQTISGANFLLNDMQRHLLRGKHQWQDEPHADDDSYYIAGIDVGGEERPHSGGSRTGSAPTQGKRDSTVLTIGRAAYNELDLPKIDIVHQYWFTGMTHADQYATLSEIIQCWNIRKTVIDATGLGEALASLLIDRFTAERIVAFKFSRPAKSKLTYRFLSMINSGRLRIYEQEGAPAAIYDECWKQIRLARSRIPGENLLDMYVQPEEGHDDYLISIALCCEALQVRSAPIVVESYIIPPARLYEWEGRY